MKSLVPMLAILVGLAAPLSAGDRSWVERAQSAPLQVVARCDSRSSRWEGGSIYSSSDVSVLRVVRGPSDSSLVVRQRGGEVDGIGQKVSHVSLLEPGRTYLLFLTKDDSSKWVPVASGVTLVDQSVAGAETVAGQPLERVLAELGGAD